MSVTNETKNTATLTNQVSSSTLTYLLTPDSNYILVGSVPDMFMATQDGSQLTNQTKNYV